MLLVAWTTIGIFVDAYKHSTDPGLESFWTPWHALFYSGFVATAAWIIRMIIKRVRPGQPLLAAVPSGYGAALAGLFIFGAGGVGDAIWHTIFGIEVSIDALLSPTHLMLFVGLVLIASAPFRAAWTDSTSSVASWRSAGTVLFSLIFSTSLVAFFLEYGFMLAIDFPARFPYDPITDDGELLVVMGILGIIVTTALIMAPIVMAVRRWGNLPFGAATLTFSLITALVVAGFDMSSYPLPAAVVAGITADLLIRGRRPTLMAGVVPLIMWSAYFIAVDQVESGVQWMPELWGGAIFFGVLTGLAVDGLLQAGRRLAEVSPAPAMPAVH
jgi:hypothetical protein